MVDYTSENHLLLSDSRLKRWLLKYSQNRRGGRFPSRPAHHDHFTASDAKPIKFLMPLADGRLHSPPFVRFSVGALVVEVSTEPWWLWYFAAKWLEAMDKMTRVNK